MKYIFVFLIWIFAFSTPLFAWSFANLDEICSLVQDGSKTDKIGGQPPVLPHINNRITTVENFAKYDNTLYMSANTFTDKYRYLGSYLMSYDCSGYNGGLTRISRLMRSGMKSELAFIRDINDYGIVTVHGWYDANGLNAYWIYDFQTKKIFPISYKKTSWYKKVAPAYVGVIENTFDGNCLTLEVKPLLDITQWSFRYWDSFDQEYCIR